MTTDTQPRVAIMIDGDNMPLSILADVEAYAAAHGEVTVRRVYGLEPALTGWRQVEFFKKFQTEGGKNATDFALSMDAVELAAKDMVDVVVVVSNDGDFVFVARKLASMGIRAKGFGTQNASKALRSQFTGFKVAPQRSSSRTAIDCMLEGLQSGELALVDTPTEDRIADMAKELLRHGDGEHGLPLGMLGILMNSTFGVTKAELPTRNWRLFLETRPEDFRFEGEGSETRVVLMRRDEDVAPPAEPDPVPVVVTEVQIDRAIRRIIRKEGRDNEILAAQLALHMEVMHGLTAKDLPTRRWQKYLEGKPEQFELLSDGSAISVRLAAADPAPAPQPESVPREVCEPAIA